MHLHAYYFRTDGTGVRFRNLDTLVFQEVTPRADLCRGGAQDRVHRTTALHGLYYVALKKRGTLETSTNYHVWDRLLPESSVAHGVVEPAQAHAPAVPGRFLSAPQRARSSEG